MLDRRKVNPTSLLIFLVLAFVGLMFIANHKILKTAETINIPTFLNKCDPNLLPLSVALEKGYFTKENINVNRVNPANLIQNFKEGKFDSGIDVLITGRGQFYPLEDKYPGLFKVFNLNVQDESKWNDAVIVTNKSKVTNLRQLKGKTIGITTSANDESGGKPRFVALSVMLEKNGLNSAEFKMIEATLNDLENNTVSALYIRDPELALSLYSDKNKILVEGPIFAKYILSPWPMSVSAISSTFMKQKPETAKQIVRIWDQAIDFIRENPIEADKILQACMKKNYGLDDAEVRQLNYWKNNEIDKNLVQKQLKWYYSISATTKELNVNDLLYLR